MALAGNGWAALLPGLRSAQPRSDAQQRSPRGRPRTGQAGSGEPRGSRWGRLRLHMGALGRPRVAGRRGAEGLAGVLEPGPFPLAPAPAPTAAFPPPRESLTQSRPRGRCAGQPHPTPQIPWRRARGRAGEPPSLLQCSPPKLEWPEARCAFQLLGPPAPRLPQPAPPLSKTGEGWRDGDTTP